MNHAIYTGSFAALEARWIAEVADLQREDPLTPVNVLVGSNVLASYLKRRLASGERAVANVRFHTFLDLVERLATVERGNASKPRIPPLGASIILEDILGTHPPAVYTTVCNYAGFRDAVLDTFRDLRDAEITPQALDSAIKTYPLLDRHDQLMGLADLYTGFRDKVSLFQDVDDDFRAAIRNAPLAPEKIGCRQLLVYGIYDVTGQQARLLASLKDSVDMTYFVPYVDRTISEFARPFIETLVAELGVDGVHLHTTCQSNSLGCLVSRGFGMAAPAEIVAAKADSPVEGLEADGSFALVSVPGGSRAAVEIGREVFRALRDGIITGFHDVAVIFRQPEVEVPILAETFRLRGIPYFVHGGSNLADRPLSKAIMAIASLEAVRFSREAIFTAMELVAAALPESVAVAWDVQQWRALTNEPRFLAGEESWNTGTAALIEEARRNLHKAGASTVMSAEDEEAGSSISAVQQRLEAAQSLRTAWCALQQAAAGWPLSLSWKEWAQLIDQRFSGLLSASRDWPLFSAVIDGLSNLDHVIRTAKFERQVSRDKLAAALMQLISSLSYPEGRFQRRGVNLFSTSAARGLCFPLVIIPGLEEGRFPVRLRQDPLLLDAERLHIGGLSLKSQRVEEEKLLFEMAARSAEKRLVLMTSRLDESSDRERIPSQFFLRVAAAVRGGAVCLRDLKEGTIPGFRSVSLDRQAPRESEIAIDEGEIRLRLLTARRDSARTVLKALAPLEPLRLDRSLAFDSARWSRKLTEFDGRLRDPRLIAWTAERMGASAGQVSASRLEEYAKCPYFFFLKRVMGLEAWEEPEAAVVMDPLERGLIIHSILEGFLHDFCGERFAAAPQDILEQSLESRARVILDKSRPAGMPDLLWEIESEGLLMMLRNWLVYEKNRIKEGLFPAQLERVFGEFSAREQYPALRVKAGRHHFAFRGRIDRIDFSADGKRARVIDYKTGTLPKSMAGKTRTPLMSGERIQIVIYHDALSVLEEFQDVEAVDGEYLHLQPKDGRIVPCSFTGEELRQASQELPRVLKILGDGIISGVFFARTKGAVWPYGHCEYCHCLPICGKDRTYREESKTNDPAVRRFMAIQNAVGISPAAEEGEL